MKKIFVINNTSHEKPRRGFAKKNVILLLTGILLMSGACTNGQDPLLPFFPTSEIPSASETVSESVFPEIESEPVSESPTVTVTEDWTPPKPYPDYSLGITPEICNNKEFDHYMEYIMENRQNSFCFYACDGFSIDNDFLLYRYSLPYVSTGKTKESENKDYWNVYIEYYPGTRIADAYENKNISGLNADEIRVYTEAADFIEREVNPENNLLKKERIIHDYIVNRTLYTNPSSDDPIPRHCTATGLMLDGEANCQGYADAFNMLARMAGFEVQSQSGIANDSNHVWNIIKLDGTWYSVDLTYNDTTFFSDGSGYPAYIYFNAGRDYLELTHEIIDGNHAARLPENSDENYFYFSPVFDDVSYGDNEIEDLAALLCHADDNNLSFVSYMDIGKIVKSADIVNPVYALTENRYAAITVSAYTVGENTYLCAYR